MMCMLLAACNCDRVPTLLFIRPDFEQRRWNVDGEIEKEPPLTYYNVSQWTKKVFVPAANSSREMKDRPTDQFSAMALGFPAFSVDSVFCQLSPSFKLLLKSQILGVQLDGDEVFLRISNTSKEEIWEQTSTKDRLFIWVELLILVIHSFPDPYAEALWRNVQYSCVEVIDSTILPFLSVLESSHLRRLQGR